MPAAGGSALLFRPTQHTILVIDDETDILEIVVYNLRQEGYRVLEARTGEEGLSLAVRERPSLVVLDLMLPDLPGLEICRHLRENAPTASIPVLMLTARGAEIDRISGFESGAADYLTKPFSVRELLLRIRARLLSKEPAGDAPVPSRPLRAGKLEIDPASHRVLLEGKEIHLSLLEFKLLARLVENRGRVQTRDILLEQVWGMTADVTTRTVDTHIKRLRDKLGRLGKSIETIRGVGYRFSEEG